MVLVWRVSDWKWRTHTLFDADTLEGAGVTSKITMKALLFSLVLVGAILSCSGQRVRENTESFIFCAMLSLPRMCALNLFLICQIKNSRRACFSDSGVKFFQCNDLLFSCRYHI